MALALSIMDLLLAGVPAALFFANLRRYRRLPPSGARPAALSVLIPARDEASQIGPALESILRAEAIEIEVLVLDDLSTDRTAAIVEELARRDPRVRLLSGQASPAGWVGKNFACQQLADAARFPILLFLDADVRVCRRDSLARVANFMEQSNADLASGLPHQQTGTAMEKLIVPLIHFVLLGFLPIGRMRASTDPRMAAACGQILAVRRAAYEQAGGHRAIAGCCHEAVALARRFRRRGLRTDLFDATDSFACRMYRSASQVWMGFAKNAHEGLGSPRLIIGATLVLFGGQVLPMILLFTAADPWVRALSGVALVCSLGVRLAAAVRFGQSVGGALCQPLSICLLLLIQWQAALFRLAGRPILWKGRPVSARA